MLIDQHRLERKLREVRGGKRRRQAGDGGKRVERIVEQIERSVKRRERRAANVPPVKYSDELPIAQRKDEIAEAIRNHQVVVICGETGSGKSTQLPKICLELGRGVAGLIGHTQPRRVAARTIAARIAEELNSPLGTRVGYKIRFGDTVSEHSYIKIMTDGVVLAETRSDPDLRQYDTIIIDEAHERGLNIDFLLGYIKRLLPRRPDLKVIITSATIDPQRFSKHFDDAPIIEVSGRMYPVELRYRPLMSDDPDDDDRDTERGIRDAVRELAEGDLRSGGDMLIFLSSERDIREMAKSLRGMNIPGPQTEILPLYARLSAAEQNKVFQPHRGRRIVLATNVAETSLTVPGIKAVIDPGFARVSRYSARSQVQRLPIEAISQASADQRMGRCGRISDGICIRLYSETDYQQRERFTPPEILRTNLASVILQMKSLGLGEIDDFPFVEPPRGTMIRDGYLTLHELGALDEWGKLTSLGRDLAKLPIDPRLGRMILQAYREGCLRDVLVIASALAIQDPRERPHEQRDQADEAHKQWAEPDSDFLSLRNLWNFYREQSHKLSGGRLRKLCKTNHLSFMRMREWNEMYHQLLEIINEAELSREPGDASHNPLSPARKRQGGRRSRRTRQGLSPSNPHVSPPSSPPARDAGLSRSVSAHPEAVHRCILAGLLSRVGVKGDGHEYIGAHNRKFFIFPGSTVFNKAPKWIMAAEIVETTKLYARTVSRIQPEWIERLAGHLVKRTYNEPHWDVKAGQVMAQERVTLYGLEVIPRRQRPYGPINPELSREIMIRAALIEGDDFFDAPFYQHNLELITEIRQTEAKLRRRDLLADDQLIYEFYDQRIPKDVFSRKRFEKWRRRVEKKRPDLLFMRRDDLITADAPAASPDAFPNELVIGRSKLPLEYRFEPGHPEDGVTVRVPQALMNQLSLPRLEWLVPGLLQEKVTALIKSLPKATRRHFVPAPDFAAACVERITFGEGSLPDVIARELHAMTGHDIPRDAWQIEQLPPHLRMNIAVVDGEGHVIAMERDLAELRERLGVTADEQSEASTTNICGQAFADHELHQDGLTAWTFGDLPTEVTIEQQGVTVTGYPALIDQDDAVGIRLFDTLEAAARSHRHGLARLIMLAYPDETRYQRDHLPGFDNLAIYAAELDIDNTQALRDQLMMRIIELAFLSHGTDVRAAHDLERVIESGWHETEAVTERTITLLREILEMHHDLAMELSTLSAPQFAEPTAEIASQLARLLPGRFLRETPQEWLEQYPRYLKAVRIRMEKLTSGRIARDREMAREFEPLWQACLDLMQQHERQGRFDPELERYRWMLEEYRVALFAQELGTAVKVSPKRLETQWARIGW